MLTRPTTATELIGNLDPGNPASIQALIDFHRTAFGGWQMNADADAAGQNSGQGTGQGSGSQTGPDSGAAGTGAGSSSSGKDSNDGDEPLGEGGMAALKSERDARKALQKQITDIQAAQQSQMEKLAEAFGIKKPDAKDGTSAVVTALQEQMAALQHNNLVLTVAGDHKITDADDLALLRDASSEDSMRKLAKRLSVATSSDDGKQKNTRSVTPRPDRSQGTGGAGQKKPGEDGLAEARKRWPKPANQQ